MKLKPCEVRRGWGNNSDLKAWKARPEYRTDRGFAIDERWAIVRTDLRNAWTLIHRPTGFAASQALKTKKAAVALVAALYERYSEAMWDFVDFEKARDFPEAKAICKRYESDV